MKNIPSTPTIRDYVIKSHVEPNEVLEKVNKVFGKNIPSTEVSPVGAVAKKVKKILWVEDDRLLSTILARKIESSGFSLLKANSGDEAMKFLETEIPDVIVLDIMLPGMNGMDILQKIKMEEKLRKIPVMMLTNLNRQSDIEKAKVLGANKFMVKAAASLDEIINAVNELIPASAK
jgi:CheY-like chemotaxis protein